VRDQNTKTGGTRYSDPKFLQEQQEKDDEEE
jgi:hypothetical protein